MTRYHAGCDLCLGLEFDVATYHDVRGEAEHWVLAEATVEQRFLFVEEVCAVVGPGGEQSDCFVGMDVRDSFEVFDAVNSAADGEHAGIGEVVAGPEFEHDRADPCLDVCRRSGHCQSSDCFEVDEQLAVAACSYGDQGGDRRGPFGEGCWFLGVVVDAP
ncbi:MAG: hypothetical protein FD127_1760 [Acidimicrobiaceae bacterium]|nr:MAG: hypothetical protein FD127_1760 [Acidimicrobiaceae bacterium]